MALSVLLDLRSRINASSPLDRLPPEILLHIFEHLACCSYYDDVTPLDYWDRLKTPVRTRQLFVITHVCRRWREVSLNVAGLWKRANDFKPDRIDTFLERSRDAAISLHLQVERIGTLTQFLADCGHRLKHLDITLHAILLLHLPSLQTFRAPNLESLTIVSEADLPVQVSDREPVLFCDRISSLKALAIDPAHICIPTNEFPHLTHLYLAKFSSPILSGDIIARLLELLSNTPALQYLHIEGLDRNASHTVATRTASLHSLRGLTCGGGDLQSALCLLSNLDVPADITIRMDRVKCLTPNHIALVKPLPCQAFLASFTRLEITAAYDDLHLIADGPRSGLWIQADCAHDHQWDEWLARLCTMFPLPSVTTLLASAVDRRVIPSLLRQLPRLTTVAVYIRAGPLDERENAPSASHELASSLYAALGNTELPHLEVLALGAKAAHPDKLSPADLVSMVAARSGLGRPLQRLDIDLIDFWPDRRARYPVAPDVDLFQAAFAPAAEHVEALQLFKNAGVCHFELREMWTTPEAERYWNMPEESIPFYRLYWH